MSFSLGWVLLNTAYFVYALSGLFKDMLQLRVVWMIATVFFISHGIVDQLWPAVWWNLPVMAIHLWMVTSLLRARRGILLDDEALAIQTLIFPDLDRVSFNTMWHLGEERTVTDEVLITKGDDVTNLMLILDGEVDVEVDEELIVRLSQFRLIGEMSSLSDSAASATVRALGDVRVRSWNKAALTACGKKHPDIQLALIKAMGQEVARKMN